MNKSKIKRGFQFSFFIFPCYFIIAFMCYCLYQGVEVWSESAFAPLTLIVIGNIITGIFLIKKQYWFSIFIILYGVYLVCTSKNHPFIFEVISLYGAYLIAHFSLCSLYVFKNRKK